MLRKEWQQVRQKLTNGDTPSNKDMHELGKHAQCQNALNNRLSLIAQRIKKVTKGKNRAYNMEKRFS